MAKVLVIRKTDKTIHKVPLSNKASLMAYNNLQPEGKKWKFEEMDEAEAEKLPFIDESYVTAAEAQDKAKELELAVEEKDALIAELNAKLAALNTPVAEAQDKAKGAKK
jgi:FMN-dependent NADH-azoreductase